MTTLRTILGIAVAVAIAFVLWQGWENYGRFANVPRWTGDRGLGWLRPWLAEFRTILLCVTGFLLLTVINWLWEKSFWICAFVVVVPVAYLARGDALALYEQAAAIF